MLNTCIDIRRRAIERDEKINNAKIKKKFLEDKKFNIIPVPLSQNV